MCFPPPRGREYDRALLPSPSGTSGSLGLQDAPETTAEAPILPTNLHGAWPTTIVYSSPSPGLDLLSFTGQSAVSAAVLGEGLSALRFCGQCGGAELQGTLLLLLVSVKKDCLPGARLWLTLCVLGGGSFGRDEQVKI